METKFCFLSFFFSSDFPLLIHSFFANCYMISVVSFQLKFLLFYFEVFHAFFLFLSLLLPALPPAFQSLPQANSWQNYLVGHSQVQTVRGEKPLPLKRRQKRTPKRSPKKRKSPKPSRIQSRKGKRKCAAHRSVLTEGASVAEHTGQLHPHGSGRPDSSIGVICSPGSWIVFGHPSPVRDQRLRFLGVCLGDGTRQ